MALYFRSQRKTRLAITKKAAMFLEKCKWSTAGDVRLSKCRSAESDPVFAFFSTLVASRVFWFMHICHAKKRQKNPIFRFSCAFLI